MVKPLNRVTQNGEAEAAPTSGRFRALAALSAAVAMGLSALSPASAAEKPAPGEPAVSGDAGLRIARAFRTAGDPSSSLQIYRNLTSQLPPDAPLRIEFADALLEARAIDEAIGLYMAAPNNPRAELGLARAQMALNQPAKALTFVDRAVVLAPRDVAVLVGRGVILDRLGRHSDAQASYRQALATAPRSLAARTDLALSLALSGRCDEALEILEPIARSATATPRDRQNLAFIYGLKGDEAAARSLGRADLGEAAAASNAEFLAQVRAQMKPASVPIPKLAGS
jgi:Flp pilus assembly protein TadD